MTQAPTRSGKDDSICKSVNVFTLSAGLLGFLAVALGALGAHLFRERLELHDGSANYQLAKLYLFIHALALAGVAIQLRVAPSRWGTLAGSCLLFGACAFPGSLLVLSLTGWKAAGYLAPFGGMALMAGWLAWGLSGILHRRNA